MLETKAKHCHGPKSPLVWATKERTFMASLLQGKLRGAAHTVAHISPRCVQITSSIDATWGTGAPPRSGLGLSFTAGADSKAVRESPVCYQICLEPVLWAGSVAPHNRILTGQCFEKIEHVSRAETSLTSGRNAGVRS